MLKNTRTISAEDLDIDQAKDAMHILPLQMISLATPGLKRMYLVKDARLNTQVEVFRGQDSGHGLIGWNTLQDIFPAHREELMRDMPTLVALSGLPSFDIFSLRIGLRKVGVEVNDNSSLSLSKKTQESLAEYMREFTKPLIAKIYGADDHKITSFSDIVQLFKNPDKTEALKNLRQMSHSLNIQLVDIPAFIEDYGDIFLSVAYYRSNFENIRSLLLEFPQWADGLKENTYLMRDKDLMRRCKAAQDSIETIQSTLLCGLCSFQERFDTFWNDININSFHEIKQIITSNHRALGGALCGISVKMKAWERNFPTREGSPASRADFIIGDISPGLDKISDLVNSIRA